MLTAVEVAECVTDSLPDGIDSLEKRTAEMGRRVWREDLREQFAVVLVERPALARDDVANFLVIEEFADCGVGRLVLCHARTLVGGEKGVFIRGATRIPCQP